jgi:hypothetical protein
LTDCFAVSEHVAADDDAGRRRMTVATDLARWERPSNMQHAPSPLGQNTASRLRKRDWSWLCQPTTTLVTVIVGLTLVRALVAANTGLTDDEAYYRLWALAPAMSYLDHPPMVGWMIAAGRWIAGDTSHRAVASAGPRQSILVAHVAALGRWRRRVPARASRPAVERPA